MATEVVDGTIETSGKVEDRWEGVREGKVEVGRA